MEIVMAEKTERDCTPAPIDWRRPWTMYEQPGDSHYTRIARAVLAKLWDTDRFTGDMIGAPSTVRILAEVIRKHDRKAELPVEEKAPTSRDGET